MRSLAAQSTTTTTKGRSDFLAAPALSQRTKQPRPVKSLNSQH